MRRLVLAAAIAALAGFASGPIASAQTLPSASMAGSRPAADIASDHLRHPQQVMAFAGVKPGDTVIELVPEGGYYTRLLSIAVGPNGKVFAIVPSFMAEHMPKQVTSERALAAEPGFGNVTVVVEGLGSIADQGPADVVWTSQNYHDLHNPSLPPDAALTIDKAVFAALKPGGVFLVEDHVAPAGSGIADVASLHRIDPAFAKSEIEMAGLRFDGSSDVLANPADPHTAVVFDPSIRGHTDQFVFRFKKPG